MTHTFTTEDPKEALRIIKATDMAIALFQITHNLKKQVENRYPDMVGDYFHTGIDASFDMIQDEIDRWGINLDELID